MNWATELALRCRVPTPQSSLFERFKGRNGVGGETRTIFIVQKYIIKSTISYIWPPNLIQKLVLNALSPVPSTRFLHIVC